ncbi:hypothetical protein [Rhabdothermincola salaria]|uniref:hypothetical protein n=1 Tax=Rhabdothermincola salaria TaxID=2903142 RepID=UPI001E5BA6E3|nr:hypothetical protein [Rhabdothermincola salaria]MCD9625246.1 hypothetical protein [Rhabdothermincola salaria]
MTLESRLRHLEGTVPQLIRSDNDVLKAIEMGRVDEGHLAWVKSVVADHALASLWATAFLLRNSHLTEEQMPPDVLPFAMAARVLAVPAHEPVPSAFVRALGRYGYRMKLTSSAIFEDSSMPRILTATWMRWRLVVDMLGADLGRGLRSDLDAIVLRPSSALLPVGLTQLPTGRAARVRAFSSVLDVGDIPIDLSIHVIEAGNRIVGQSWVDKLDN